MRRDKYEKTTNLNLAIFLYAKGGQICGIDGPERGQKEFIFIRVESLDELISAYKFPSKDDKNLLVDVHKYENARRYLLDRINE